MPYFYPMSRAGGQSRAYGASLRNDHINRNLSLQEATGFALPGLQEPHSLVVRLPVAIGLQLCTMNSHSRNAAALLAKIVGHEVRRYGEIE